MIKVKVRLLDGALLPEYHSSGSAGADIFARLDEPVVISQGKTVLVPTGLIFEIPGGYEAQIRPRSGLALKHGITFLNSPGTIDSDYRGEIKIIVSNFGDADFIIDNGMKIGQIVFARVYRGEFAVVEEVSQTERDQGGFGHSGI